MYQNLTRAPMSLQTDDKAANLGQQFDRDITCGPVLLYLQEGLSISADFAPD